MVTLAQAQDGTSCASLQHYVDEHPRCGFFYDCSTLYCYSDSDVIYRNLSVHKCEDPVSVDVYVDVYDEDSNSFHGFIYSYNRSETVDFGQESFTGTLERNATYLGFMVSVCTTGCSYL